MPVNTSDCCCKLARGCSPLVLVSCDQFAPLSVVRHAPFAPRYRPWVVCFAKITPAMLPSPLEKTVHAVPFVEYAAMPAAVWMFDPPAMKRPPESIVSARNAEPDSATGDHVAPPSDEATRPPMFVLKRSCTRPTAMTPDELMAMLRGRLFAPSEPHAVQPEPIVSVE